MYMYLPTSWFSDDTKKKNKLQVYIRIAKPNRKKIRTEKTKFKFKYKIIGDISVIHRLKFLPLLQVGSGRPRVRPPLPSMSRRLLLLSQGSSWPSFLCQGRSAKLHRRRIRTSPQKQLFLSDSWVIYYKYVNRFVTYNLVLL